MPAEVPALVESIPNVSEGRDPSVLAELVHAIDRVPDAWLLDHSADPSHHRSVYTLAGSVEGVRAAILDLVQVAVARIDLRAHAGVHPRIGAVDVVPFVPLEGATMGRCVELAREVGREIAERFGLPVFLYEEAALRPARRRLEQIRRGGFEGLAARMREPEWFPDFGPRVPHPSAGATVVGARRPLIAFNVNLATDRVDIAKEIAAVVRESGGGLPCVKALGLYLAHKRLAQVSMNLTNYERTPIEVAFERVVREAERRGVGVVESELIGLIPQAALAGTTPGRLQLTNFSPGHVLETRLAAVRNTRLR
jgi:glutamate formiminotransferase